jgi:hypothetical protein
MIDWPILYLMLWFLKNSPPDAEQLHYSRKDDT